LVGKLKDEAAIADWHSKISNLRGEMEKLTAALKVEWNNLQQGL